MDRAAVDTFEKLVAQLNSLRVELTMLAKKSPKDAVNEFKRKFINLILAQCNSLFGKDDRPFAEFETIRPIACHETATLHSLFLSTSNVRRNSARII